jgi:O-antigen ligase
MTAKNYQNILQIGTLLSFCTIFLVSSSLIFPYITSKQLMLNLIVELMIPIWLILIWRYPKFRPKKKLIAYALIAYCFAILLSCFFSVDFNLSFWGDAERMLGFFHLSHYFLLFFYFITAWRNQKEWNFILGFFLILGVAQSIIYLFGKNLIGNTAYLSGYLIFNIFLSFILYLKTIKPWRYLWLLSLIPLFMAFFQARTSGAIIGLTVSFLILIFLLGVLSKNKKRRIYALSLLGIAILTIIIIFSQSNQDWFQSNRFLVGLTVNKPTFQTRLISWQAAFKEFPNNPIFGVGHGAYAMVFDKQFDSRFLNYSRNESYFDRAHNNLIDITATTGLVGLITYLSIFVALFYYLFRLLKQRGFRVYSGKKGAASKEILLLFALFIAYFIQNLAIFDTQTTYLSLMIILAYVTFLVEIELGPKEEEKELDKKPVNFCLKLVIVLSIIFSLFLIRINYLSWHLFQSSINVYKEIVSGQIESGLSNFRLTMENYSPIKRDARAIIINYFNNNSEQFVDIEDLEYIVSLAQDNLSYNPKDSRKNLQLSQVLNNLAKLREEESDKYYNQSLKAINKAIEYSPNRAPLYLAKAQVHLGLGQYDEVRDQVEKSITLNSDLPDPYCYLAQIEFSLDDKERALDLLDQCLKRDGINKISLSNLLILGLEDYSSKEDYVNRLIILKQLERMKVNQTAVYLELTKTYLHLNEADKAKASAQKLVNSVEEIDNLVDIFISLANEMLSNNYLDEAILSAQIAVELDPSLTEALNNFIEEINDIN